MTELFQNSQLTAEEDLQPTPAPMKLLMMLQLYPPALACHRP